MIERKTIRKVVMATCAASMTFALVSIFSLDSSANVNVPPVCKVEVIDCPGIGTGDRQVCITTGGGLTCTCGEATECPKS